MSAGYGAVVWKEWRELRSELLHGKGRMQLAGIAVGGGFLGLASPSYLTDWTTVFTMAFIAVLCVTMVVADILCGERERHTFDTLLASRLSDSAILFGKATAIFLYASVISLAAYVTSIVAFDLHTHSGLLLPAGLLLLATCVGIVCGAAFFTGLGVLLTLRATSVKQTQMMLSFGMIAVMFVGIFVWEMVPPSTKGSVVIALSRLGIPATLGIVTVVVLAISAVFLGLARARFQRARMLLD